MGQSSFLKNITQRVVVDVKHTRWPLWSQYYCDPNQITFKLCFKFHCIYRDGILFLIYEVWNWLYWYPHNLDFLSTWNDVSYQILTGCYSHWICFRWNKQYLYTSNVIKWCRLWLITWTQCESLTWKIDFWLIKN